MDMQHVAATAAAFTQQTAAAAGFVPETALRMGVEVGGEIVAEEVAEAGKKPEEVSSAATNATTQAGQALKMDPELTTEVAKFVAEEVKRAEQSRYVDSCPAPKWDTFAQLDLNHDGHLSPQELMNWRPFDMFSILDLDLDRQLSFEELKQWPDPRADHIFDFLDADGDGRLSTQELQRWKLFNSSFDRLDKDGGGDLNWKELTAKWRPPRNTTPDDGFSVAHESFEELDRDGNQRLSLDELAHQKGENVPAFQALDRDGNGRLSMDELQKLMQTGDAGVMFETLDFNKDKKLSRDELQRWKPRDSFGVLDKNQDGQLTPDELQLWHANAGRFKLGGCKKKLCPRTGLLDVTISPRLVPKIQTAAESSRSIPTETVI